MAATRGIHGCFLILLLVSFLSKFRAIFSQATPTLFPNQTISDGQLLVSANKTFALGFFSPNGSTNRYVGIWYHNLSIQTVVWVANRERPLLDFSGYIAFDSQGNLNILNSIGSSIQIASSSGGMITTTATILDSGNLVLEANMSVLWQSFDNPTDTMLPYMKLGLSGKKNHLLTSWTSPQNPSPGEFSLGINTNGTREFLIWRKGTVYLATGVWNGQIFGPVGQPLESDLSNLGFVSNWSGGYYSFHLQNSSIITRGVMDFTGQVKRLAWSDDKWVEMLPQAVIAACQIPDYCGPNGLCSNSSSQPCSCLSGFKPTIESQWELGNRADGCTRELPLECGYNEKNGFLRLSIIKLPKNYLIFENSSVSLADCKAHCVSNCSCTAYAFQNGKDDNGCLLWFGDLTGLQGNSDGLSQSLYVRIVDSDHRRKKIVLIVIPVVVVVIILLSTLMYYFTRQKHPVLTGIFQSEIKHADEKDCSLFNFSTITTATDNFSSSNKLGEGGFGPVYKGILENRVVAVKRLSKNSGQGLVEFKNEITLISKLQHTNLVSLVGYCIEHEENLLIYEYMPNKSLDSYIFDPIKRTQLDWSTRFCIIEGIAQGLLYLHKYSRLRIIHRDLKASNILLDGELNPKISDFEMARIFKHGEGNQANTQRVVGTLGYMSPEYAISGLFSMKSDVFSFGVLLLEIISGKKNTTFQHSETFATLVGYAWQLWEEGRGLELKDELLGNVESSHEVLRCIQVALLCVQDCASDRPAMSLVVSMLRSEVPLLPTPKQPVFSLVKTVDDNSHGILTPNSVTMTAVEGR